MRYLKFISADWPADLNDQYIWSHIYIQTCDLQNHLIQSQTNLDGTFDAEIMLENFKDGISGNLYLKNIPIQIHFNEDNRVSVSVPTNYFNNNKTIKPSDIAISMTNEQTDEDVQTQIYNIYKNGIPYIVKSLEKQMCRIFIIEEE